VTTTFRRPVAQFRPKLGAELYDALTATLKVDERANPQGSAYQAGWWGLVQRDLRLTLGDPVRSEQPVRFCGEPAECRTALLGSLAAALKVPAATTYPATASSYESGLLGSYPAVRAVDGNPSTRWASRWSDPQRLRVDLGASTPVARVVMRWEAAYGKAYRIEVSSHGASWSTAYATEIYRH
jgi:hypothetical protein